MKHKQTSESGDRVSPKKNGPRRWIFRGLFLICLAVFVWSAWNFGSEFWRYYASKKEYANLAQNAKKPAVESVAPTTASVDPEPDETEADAESEPAPSQTSDTGNGTTDVPISIPDTIDFNYLSSINSDVIAWITIPGTNVDYPVVQTTDNDYYLHYSFERKEYWIGCPFLDYRLNADFTSPNSCLYGHDVNDNAISTTMFAEIKKLLDSDFRSQHPYIYIYLPDKTLVYEVYSTYNASKVNEMFYLTYANDAEYQVYLDQSIANADYDTGIRPTVADRILTLVTCNKDRNFRSVVQAVLREELPAVH